MMQEYGEREDDEVARDNTVIHGDDNARDNGHNGLSMGCRNMARDHALGLGGISTVEAFSSQQQRRHGPRT